MAPECRQVPARGYQPWRCSAKSHRGAPPAAPQAKEPAFRLPRLEVAVPALPLPAVMPEPGTTINQPKMKLGEGDTASSSRKGGGSPVLKSKLPKFGAAAGEDEEGDAGARGGFTRIRDLLVLIAAPIAAVELVPELSVPRAEPAVTSGQPRLELDSQYQLMHAVARVNKRLVFLLPKACIVIYFRGQNVTI